MIVAELAASLGLIPNEREWDKGHELVNKLHHAIELFVGVEAVKKLGEMVSSVVEAAVAAEHLGQKVGLSSDAVQELGYAASLSGASADDLQVGLQHLARGMEELRTKGTGPAKDGLAELGLSFASLKGKTPEEQLAILADRFKALPDGPKKTTAAMDLFGRSGTALIPMLDKGSGGIAELRAEAEKLGVVIGKDGVEKAKEFEHGQRKLTATLTGLKNEAVMALLPALTDMVDRLQAWVAENKEAIASTLEAVVNGIAAAFEVLGEIVAGVTKFFQEHRDVAVAVLAAVGIALADFAAGAAIDWLLALGPIAPLVAAIAGIIYIVEKMGDAFGDVAPLIAAALALAFLPLSPILATISAIVAGITFISENLDEIFGTSADAAEGAPGLFGYTKEEMGQAPAKKTVGSVPTDIYENQASVMARFGDTHLTVYAAAGMDEKAVAELAAKKVEEKNSAMLKQALASVHGAR